MNPEDRKFLRRMLAAHALQGILAGAPRVDEGYTGRDLPVPTPKRAAIDAFNYAEALVLELEREERIDEASK